MSIQQMFLGLGGPGASSGASASGGNVNALEPGNGYTYHTFTSPGTIVVSGGDLTAEVLMVGGGGQGGSNGGGGGTGGGGGGGLLSGSLTLTPGSYPITVAATTPDSEGQDGNDTTAFGATATGGGSGGHSGGGMAAGSTAG